MAPIYGKGVLLTGKGYPWCGGGIEKVAPIYGKGGTYSHKRWHLFLAKVVRRPSLGAVKAGSRSIGPCGKYN